MLEENFNSLAAVTPNYSSGSMEIDTVFQKTKPRSALSYNMSFAERGLWGEEGLFRKIGLVPELTREQRKVELGIRRTMLTAHQIGGFATLGLMLATAYLGQKVIDGRRDLGDIHKTFAEATMATYTFYWLTRRTITSASNSPRRNQYDFNP